MATILVTEVQVGDVVEVVEGEKILVKTIRRVASFIRFTAFGHAPTDCWYVHVNASVEKGELTFTVENSTYETLRQYIQLPLPFPLEV